MVGKKSNFIELFMSIKSRGFKCFFTDPVYSYSEAKCEEVARSIVGCFAVSEEKKIPGGNCYKQFVPAFEWKVVLIS